MNKQKQNKASLHPMYFQIDREQDKTVNITFEENNMSKCDFVLITADDLQSNDQFKEDEIVTRTRSWLKKSYPNGDWFHRVSKNENHIFWKHEKTLKDRKDRMGYRKAV